MPNFTPHPDYDKLPLSIQAEVSEQEFAWMTDAQRDRLIDDFVYPEPENEGALE